MTAREKLIAQILAGRSDGNIPFTALCELLAWLGFRERTSGSHHVFAKEGVAEIINLQPLPGDRAKPYQVKQVRHLLVRYKLAGESDER